MVPTVPRAQLVLRVASLGQQLCEVLAEATWRVRDVKARFQECSARDSHSIQFAVFFVDYAVGEGGLVFYCCKS